MNWNMVKIIDEFNSSHSIKYVIETVTGQSLKGKSMCCPMPDHKGDRDNPHGASINEGKNIFSCWSSDCGKGLTPWNFIKKYYGLQGFKEVAEKVNSLFNTNIPIYNKTSNTELININNYDITYKVNNYLSECVELQKELQEFNHLLLNANTGLGKTYGIVDLNKNTTYDYVFFLTPSRALAESVSNEYGYELFYGNDTEFKGSKYISATFNKIGAINRNIDRENQYRSLLGQPLVTYTVVIDEVHELMSKRRLLGEVAREIEAFVLNSDESILMSANTKDIYEAYKDNGLFNRYISVESKDKLYNSDNTHIYRIPTKVKQRHSVLLDKIIDSLTTHSNILLMEDNKKNLEIYSQILSKNGIENIMINSDNKNDEEVAEEYNSIVEENKLKKIVVLCTSLINAGVNIKNDNTCTMIIQDRMQFDTNKIEQIFGRIRSDKNNTCILFLNQGNKNKIRSSKQYYIDYYTELSELKASNLNQYYFDKYGLEPVEGDIITDWNIYRDNQSYTEVKDCIYIDNSIFKVDSIAIHEKARLDWLRSNYYDDEFILEMLKDLKTRNISISVINAKSEPTGDITTDKEEEKEDIFKNTLINVVNDVEGIKELYKYIKGDIRSKDFTNENINNLYENCRNNKRYKEMIKELKNINNKLQYIEDSTPVTIFTEILTEYTIEQKASERRSSIDNIKRIYIYNKLHPIGTPLEHTECIGDIIYYIVRKNCDHFIDSRHPISESTYKYMLIEYMAKNNCVSINGQWIDKNGKKKKPTQIEALIENCVLNIYNHTDKMYLSSLK